jgi:hypothetical protein
MHPLPPANRPAEFESLFLSPQPVIGAVIFAAYDVKPPG